MAEFWGDAEAVARQKRLLARRALLHSPPFLSSVDRLLGYPGPTLGSWDVAGPLAGEDGILGLLLMTRQDADAIVAGGLGEGWRTDYLDALVGEADAVVETSGRVLASSKQPAGWGVSVMQVPGDAGIENMQRLNASCGVALKPAYVFRGETHPALNVLVRGRDGRAMAMAWAGLFSTPMAPVREPSSSDSFRSSTRRGVLGLGPASMRRPCRKSGHDGLATRDRIRGRRQHPVAPDGDGLRADRR